MAKSVDTVVQDINCMLKEVIDGKSVEIQEDTLAKFGTTVALKVKEALTARTKTRPPFTIYASEIGKPCNRYIWYGVHRSELGEKIFPSAKIKFLYGDLLEELLLLLASLSAHEVTEEQATREFSYKGWTIRGRIDARIDGVVVDVKSASGYGYNKFTEGLHDGNDAFGYRAQLRVYTDNPKSGFLVINKENGQLCYSKVDDNKFDLTEKLDGLIEDLNNSVNPPPRHYTHVEDGKSGNMKLPVGCSYCAYKRECWKNSNKGAGLRVFNYAGKPVFLTEVVREPKVSEITHLMESNHD